jgi:type IV pilus assembly protein PilA
MAGSANENGGEKNHNLNEAKNRKRGFSLIELLIVVAVILIIASIAIPNLLRAKIAANQSAAVQALRTMTSAEQTFSSTYSDGYALTLAQRAGPSVRVVA